MILCWALLEYIEICRWLTPKANEMTTAVLVFLSSYYLISCSSEQLERIHLYRNSFNSLAKYFPVSGLYYSTNLLNVGLCWPHSKWEKTRGSQRNQKRQALSLLSHGTEVSLKHFHLCCWRRITDKGMN